MRKILITGGCGFIGTNAAELYLKKNYQVIVLDNLSRVGSEKNLKWLKTQKGSLIFKKADIRNYNFLLAFFMRHTPDLILHLAGQTTVTGSIIDPREDFEINALGTFNVLEAMRNTNSKASLIYCSTNKVMGELTNLPIREKKKRYTFNNLKGLSEKYPLNFCSPYGCSKGCGDQYVLDYARIYKLNTVVFRLSCTYGVRQFGTEGQGWLAWFITSMIFDRPITIYGNGKQVRDVLCVADLINAFNFAFQNIKKTRGKVYTIGGGSKFAVSILDVLEILETISYQKFNYDLKPWRLADQKIYISDVSSAKKDFNWFPKISPKKGIKILYDWTEKNKNLFS